MTEHDTFEDAHQEPTSKTARKAEATRLQQLGRQLTQLTDDQLRLFPLPDGLYAAIRDYQRFPSHGAQRRQLQYIGRLMREIDTATIEAKLAALDNQSAGARFEFHQLEQWRERLLAEPNATTEFINTYPHVDRQQLRQLIKRVHAATDETQQKGHARGLFRFIKQVTEQED